MAACFKRAASSGRSRRIASAANWVRRNGRIGKIHTVIGANYPSPWECALPAQPVPDGLDWDMWCGPTEPVPYHIDLCTPRANPGWISFRTYSGGGNDRLGAPTGWTRFNGPSAWTTPARWKFGPRAPSSIRPSIESPNRRSRGEKICGSPMIFYRYANGVTVKLDNGNPGGGIFVGDKGKIEIFRGKVTSNPPEVVKEPIRDDEIHLYKSNNHIGNWLECIKSREKPIADVEIGHRSTTVCHLGNIARWVGRKLQWDPVKEIFPGDEEANAYLDRPRRRGYQLPERV